MFLEQIIAVSKTSTIILVIVICIIVSVIKCRKDKENMQPLVQVENIV
jgi:hypothetical protein